MSSNCPPQLQLTIQPNTTNFKRSFEQFGFDLESPVGPGTDVSGGGSGVDNGNDRNKRARSSSSFSESSDSADDSRSSSGLASGSESTSTSTFGLSVTEEPPVISGEVQENFTIPSTIRAPSPELPPRLPTPMIQDIDMTEVLPEILDSEPVTSQQTQQQSEDRYRLSLERFNAFESEISILRRSELSPAATRPPTPPPMLPPLSLVSSSSSPLSQFHRHPPSRPQVPSREMPLFRHPPARAASPFTENFFTDVGEGSSSISSMTTMAEVSSSASVHENLDPDDSENPSDVVLSPFHSVHSRLRRFSPLQELSTSPLDHHYHQHPRDVINDMDGEEIGVVNGFRDRLNSALERLRPASPLVPGLENTEGGFEEEEEAPRQEGNEDEEDSSEGFAYPDRSVSITRPLPLDPPTLPPIPPIADNADESVDEWADRVSFLSQTPNFTSNPVSTSQSTPASQTSRDFEFGQDRIRLQQVYRQQRLLHMHRHQQQRMLEMQQSMRLSSSSARRNAGASNTDWHTNTTISNTTPSLSSHSLPSPLLRDLRQFMHEHSASGETPPGDTPDSGRRTESSTSAPVSREWHDRIRCQRTNTSLLSPSFLHSNTSDTWGLVDSLFSDHSILLTPASDTSNSNAIIRPSSPPPLAAPPGPSGFSPFSNSSTNSNSDTVSGPISYSRNLTDEAVVRSLDHGIGAGLGFGPGSGLRSGISTTPRRQALVGEQTQNSRARGRRSTQGGQQSNSNTSEELRSVPEPPGTSRTLPHNPEYGTLPDLDLDFSSLAGTAGSTASSPSASSDWDLEHFSGPSIGSLAPPSPGVYRIPDFMNPTMSSLDFLSPTAAATASSNLPVNIRHLWGDSSASPRNTHRHVQTSQIPGAEDEGRSTTGTSNGNAATSSSSNRLLAEAQRRYEARNLRNEERNEEQSHRRRRTGNVDSPFPSYLDDASLPNRVTIRSTPHVNHQTAVEANRGQNDSFQRHRLRPFHLQTRPGSSTSLVGENAVEVRRREDHAEIMRTRLHAVYPRTHRTGDAATSTTNLDMLPVNQRDESNQGVGRLENQPPRLLEDSTESLQGSTNDRSRTRPAFDAIVQNAWQSIPSPDSPHPNDDNSITGSRFISRLFGSTAESGDIGLESDTISTSATNGVTNYPNDQDIDMLGVDEAQRGEHGHWPSFDVELTSGADEVNSGADEVNFASWLNLSTDRHVSDLSAAPATVSTSRENSFSFATESMPSLLSPPSRSVPEGSSTSNRDRRYSDIFEANPRNRERPPPFAEPSRASAYLNVVPSLPSPDLGNIFNTEPPVESTPLHSVDRSPTFGFSTGTANSATHPSSSSSNLVRLNAIARLQRISQDAESRPVSSLWSTVTREQASDTSTRRNRAELYAHLQEQRTRAAEQSARNLGLTARHERQSNTINPSAFAPGPFRNTLQHRLNEQTFNQHIQARHGLSVSNASNPPTIPPLSFGDDNLTPSSSTIQTSPSRPSEDMPTTPSETTREPPFRRDPLRPRPGVSTSDNSRQARYMPRSYASARTASTLDINRDLARPTYHSRGPHRDDFPGRTTAEAPSNLNSLSRVDESTPASRRHALLRHRPRSADGRPGPPLGQNSRPPTVVRGGLDYGRYIGLSAHLMHPQAVEDVANSTVHSQTPTSRQFVSFPPPVVYDDSIGLEGHPTFSRGRRARPHPHPHEMMFSFGRLGSLRRGRALGDFMRDEDFDESYESLLSLAQTLGDVKPKSTPAEIIEKLEKAQYKEWATADSDKRCPICLDDYGETDTVLKLNNCSHWLHQDCLHQWLQTANTCPVCRKSVGGSNAGSRRGQHHHHHHPRGHVFGGASFGFRHHPPPPRPRLSSNPFPSQRNDSSGDTAHPPQSPPPPPPPHQPSSGLNQRNDNNSGNNPGFGAPWRRGPRD